MFWMILWILAGVYAVAALVAALAGLLCAVFPHCRRHFLGGKQERSEKAPDRQ